eukprot:scaffold191378_cov28-Tisochrysis_lutea.AAC.3
MDAASIAKPALARFFPPTAALTAARDANSRLGTCVASESVAGSTGAFPASLVHFNLRAAAGGAASWPPGTYAASDSAASAGTVRARFFPQPAPWLPSLGSVSRLGGASASVSASCASAAASDCGA